MDLTHVDDDHVLQLSETIPQADALHAALQRCTALEEQLSTERREHERATTKLSALLKKRGAGDGEATEAGAELSQLRQQISVMQWREEQYKQIISKAMARPCS